MIVVRDIFRLKFGKAKEAVALWKDFLPEMEKSTGRTFRMLTDLTGEYYTLVLEGTYKNLGEYEAVQSDRRNDVFAEFYPKFVQLVDSGYREIFTIVDYD